jgi:hypothetical protein
MAGLTFRAWQHGRRYVGLNEIVQNLGALSSDLLWRLRIVDAGLSPASDQLEAIPWSRLFTSQELKELFSSHAQVVDGEVQGFQTRADVRPRIVIRAADSTWWDVESPEKDVLDTIQAHYPDAKPIPEA